MKYFLSFILIFIGSHTFLSAQSSIKLKKQKTKFFYFQINSHYGKYDVGNESVKGLSNFGSPSQFAVQFLSKNKKRLQRGYTDSWEMGNYFIRMEVKTKSSFIDSKEQIRLNLGLNGWVSVLTKWDRTSIKIGVRNLPYGHNPRIDADFSFLSPQIKKDLGFSKNFGVFFKTALSKNLDIESALTLGGYLSRSILTTRVINQEATPNEDSYYFNDFHYKGTWLFTNRIGTPTYKSMEYGIFTTIGHIYSPKNQNQTDHIARIGGDWIIKFKDMIKFANQVSVGTSNSDGREYSSSKSLSMQNTLDATLFGVLNMSVSHAWQRYNYEDTPDFNKRILTTSTTLVLTPDIKVKWNLFKEFVNGEKNRMGMYGQLIVGFGKRP